jgi:hypothetical protein
VLKVARKSWLTLVLLLAFATAPAWGQSCAMCKATAQATPKEGQRAINRAIFIMLVPPLGIMSLGIGFAFRYGKRRDRENQRKPD